jgi:hypothetical protein
MAPEAYAAAHEAREALAIDDTLEIYQSASRGFNTARLALHGKPIAVESRGDYLALLDRGALVAVFGHELGHCMAPVGNQEYAWMLPACADAKSGLGLACLLARELTADRFGLLACRDLDAALRLEMVSAAGSAAARLRLDTTAYLSQCREVTDELLEKGGAVLGATHPEHYVRGYAAWLWSESDAYRAMTGVGPGTRSITDVDATLTKLLGVRSMETRFGVSLA